MNGTVKVDRAELAKALESAGLDPSVAMRGRITINAVVRRACTACGRPQLETKDSPACNCQGGPRGKVENLGVISDSGPRRFLARVWWKIGQAFKRVPIHARQA